jgi:two-component system chemotaxis response regulator CheB
MKDIGSLNNNEFRNKFKSLILGLSKKENKMGQLQRSKNEKRKIDLIVIGASTGGPKAVKNILNSLPSTLKQPIALVQHLEKGFEEGYASWLNETSPLQIINTSEEQKLQGGVVYVAPADYHMVIRNHGVLHDNGPKVCNQKPAVDVLFSSAAKEYGKQLLGVLLTGMGNDGAKGCVDIVNNGGLTIVQDEESSDIFGMPKAAIESNGASLIKPLSEIAQTIIEIVSEGNLDEA